jgi:hypothetical protein
MQLQTTASWDSWPWLLREMIRYWELMCWVFIMLYIRGISVRWYTAAILKFFRILRFSWELHIKLWMSISKRMLSEQFLKFRANICCHFTSIFSNRFKFKNLKTQKATSFGSPMIGPWLHHCSKFHTLESAFWKRFFMNTEETQAEDSHQMTGTDNRNKFYRKNHTNLWNSSPLFKETSTNTL